MQVLSSNTISDALLVSIPRLASILPPDILEALIAARDRETHERAKIVLDQLVLNAQIANEDHVPICQDTGYGVALFGGRSRHRAQRQCLFEGRPIGSGRIHQFEAAQVGRARCAVRSYEHGDNTPAFCELRLVDEPGVARLHMMLKGGGSDNASRVVMLTPNAGKQGVIDTVLSCVEEKAANACPPLVVGVGVGGTFDKVAGLSKLALMRPLNVAAPDPETAAFEQELLEAINATGIGAGGLGGDTTALGVRVKTAPCHIAALPVAVNMGCSALRRLTVEL